MDKNNNQIPDKYEAIITYIIVFICITFAISGYHIKDMDTGTVKWLIGFAVFLTGQRDIKTIFGRL
jgi:hypothetical protein